MGWFSNIRRAVVKPVKQVSRGFSKIRKQVVKAVPVVGKVGGFVRNPAKKVIPNSIRKRSWYKKFAAPVITYGLTTVATAGVGTAIGVSAKALNTGLTVTKTFGKTRTTLRNIQGAKVQAKNVEVEQKQLAVDSQQLLATQKKIDALKLANKTRAETANNKVMATQKKIAQADNTKSASSFNVGGALVGASAGALVVGPVGAIVGGVVGGIMKKQEKKG